MRPRSLTNDVQDGPAQPGGINPVAGPGSGERVGSNRVP